MPIVSDNVTSHTLAMRVGGQGKIQVEAKVGATAVAGTPQIIYWDKDGYVTKALALSTGTATDPKMFYVGVPETAGTTGTYIDYTIAGPTKILSTAVFIAGSPALLSTGAAVISGTTSLTATGAMGEVGIFQEALPTTAVSTALFKILLYGLPKYMTS